MLITNLTSRWRDLYQLQTWSGHQGAPLASIENWVTKWHHLHLFKIWSSGGANCIGFEVVHQVESIGLPHCLRLVLSVGIELVAS